VCANGIVSEAIGLYPDYVVLGIGGAVALFRFYIRLSAAETKSSSQPTAKHGTD
jgi:hypothetical protein